MENLSLVTRRKKCIAMFQFWLSIMQLVNLFWLMVAKRVENHVKSRSLRSIYEYDFFDRRKYINKVIYLSDNICIDTTRMNRRAFVHLCSRLEATGIVSSNKNMLVDEQVAITIHILAHHQKQRTIKHNFGCARETISRHFRQVINGIITLQDQLLKKPEPVPDDSTDERWKWFKVCYLIYYLIILNKQYM